MHDTNRIFLAIWLFCTNYVSNKKSHKSKITSEVIFHANTGTQPAPAQRYGERRL